MAKKNLAPIYAYYAFLALVMLFVATMSSCSPERIALRDSKKIERILSRHPSWRKDSTMVKVTLSPRRITHFPVDSVINYISTKNDKIVIRITDSVLSIDEIPSPDTLIVYQTKWMRDPLDVIAIDSMSSVIGARDKEIKKLKKRMRNSVPIWKAVLFAIIPVLLLVLVLIGLGRMFGRNIF